MASDPLDRLDCFRAFIKATEEGAPVPPVDRYDLRRLHLMFEYMEEQHPGSGGAMSIDLLASVCGPEANLPAVWFRHTRLELLLKQGLLAEWQRDKVWDEAVYQIASTIPMNGSKFDQLEFIQRLRCEAAT